MTSSPYEDSSLITISSLNELYKFYSARNGQRNASKPLILNNSIQFRLDLFPNGQKKEQMGYVQFMVVSNKLPSNIKSIAVLCRLYCIQAQTLYKQIQIINKGNEIISWPIYCLPLNECKYSVHYNDNNNELQFGCNIELLFIKYQNNSIMDNLKLKIRKNSVVINMNQNDNENDIFRYAQLRTNAQIQYEWFIDKNVGLFKNAKNGKAYYSNDINNIWSLCCYPNGQYSHNEGHLLLSLKLLRLPPKIKSIQTHIRLQIKNKIYDHDKPQNVSFSYNDYEHTWSTGPFSTFELLNNNNGTPLKFTIVIEIKKLFEDVGKNKGREISRTNWGKYGIDILGVPQQSTQIDYGTNYIQLQSNQTNINRQQYSKSFGYYKHNENEECKYQHITGGVKVDKLRLMRSFSERPLHKCDGKEMEMDVSPSSADEITSNSFPDNINLQQMQSENTINTINTNSYPFRASTTMTTTGRPSHQHSTTSPEYSGYSGHHSSFTNKTQQTPSLSKQHTRSQTIASPVVGQDQYIPTSPIGYHRSTFTIAVKDDGVIHEEEQEILTQESKIECISKHEIKFKQWLNEVGLDRYYNNFKQEGNADIRDITSFENHEALIGIGISNKPHRNRIIEAAIQYGVMIKAFNDILDKNKTLNKYAHKFKSNAIMTLSDLENDVKSVDDLQKILDLDDNHVLEIWNLINPQLETAMKDLQERYKKVMPEMDKLIKEASEIHNKIQTNITSMTNPKHSVIKQEYDKFIDKIHDELSQYEKQIQQIKDNHDHYPIHLSRRLKQRVSNITVTSNNSSSKDSSIYTDATSTMTNYPYSHVSGSNVDGNNKSINPEMIVTGFIRKNAMKLDLYITQEIFALCLKFYSKTMN